MSEKFTPPLVPPLQQGEREKGLTEEQAYLRRLDKGSAEGWVVVIDGKVTDTGSPENQQLVKDALAQEEDSGIGPEIDLGVATGEDYEAAMERTLKMWEGDS